MAFEDEVFQYNNEDKKRLVVGTLTKQVLEAEDTLKKLNDKVAELSAAPKEEEGGDGKAETGWGAYLFRIY